MRRRTHVIRSQRSSCEFRTFRLLRDGKNCAVRCAEWQGLIATNRSTIRSPAESRLFEPTSGSRLRHFDGADHQTAADEKEERNGMKRSSQELPLAAGEIRPGQSKAVEDCQQEYQDDAG